MKIITGGEFHIATKKSNTSTPTEHKKRGRPPKKNIIDTSQFPTMYKCTQCGKIVTDPQGIFYNITKNNSLYAGNGGYANICVECCNKFFQKMVEKYSNEKLALSLTCAAMGCYFSEALYTTMKDTGTGEIHIGKYLRRLNLSQYKDLSFVDYFVSFNNSKVALMSKEELAEQFNAEWTDEDESAKQQVIEFVGYDPFVGYKSEDRKYLFNELLKYFSDDTLMEDTFKMSQIIQIVNNNNQIRQYDMLIAKLNPLSDGKDIQMLNDLKNKLVASNDKIAKENEISVKNRSNKDIGKSTLTFLMKDLREKNFEKAETDYYDQLKSAGTRWAAEISMDAIYKNAYFDESDYDEIKDIKRKMVIQLQDKVDDLTEEKRKMLIEIQRLEELLNERDKKLNEILGQEESINGDNDE